MLEVRICLLVALVVATTSVTSSEDYILPTGVTVLTELPGFCHIQITLCPAPACDILREIAGSNS